MTVPFSSKIARKSMSLWLVRSSIICEIDVLVSSPCKTAITSGRVATIADCVRSVSVQSSIMRIAPLLKCDTEFDVSRVKFLSNTTIATNTDSTRLNDIVAIIIAVMRFSVVAFCALSLSVPLFFTNLPQNFKSIEAPFSSICYLFKTVAID